MVQPRRPDARGGAHSHDVHGVPASEDSVTAAPPLQYDDQRGVILLTLDRPHVRNAIDASAMDALAEAAGRLEDHDSLVAVVLTGAGDRAFCSGGDLGWMRSLGSPADGEEMSRRMQTTLARLAGLPVPVVAALNGAAVGGGAEIALAADLRFAEEHVRLTFKQGRMGLAPGWGGAARLRRTVGYGRALDLLATGATVSAQEAAAMGLVDRVVPTGAAVDEALAWAERVRPLSGRSVGVMKRMLRGADDAAAAIDREAGLFREVWASPQHREAVSAFFEKRPATLRS